MGECFVAAMLGGACVGDGGGDGGTGTGDTSAGSTPSSASQSESATTPTVSATMPSTDDADGSDDLDSTDTVVDTGDESSTTGEPTEPEVHWIGRYDDSDPAFKRFGWSGVGFVVRFDGTGASVTMDDAAGWWTLVVDGQVQPPFTTSGGEQSYTLATGLPAGEHTIEMYRRTEGSFGPSNIAEPTLEGELLPPPAVTRRIEIIGDSITCGYGNEGANEFCNFSADTENHYLSYGAVAARAVGAELQTVAWSGKGLVNNYGDDTFEPMPMIYDRTVASEQASWDFSWQPDVVVINLGTNDFSTDGDPGEGQFVPAYVGFLAHLRDVYPDALLLPISPSLGGDELTMVEGYIQSAIDMRAAAGDTNIATANINTDPIGWGCDYHPSVATHAVMGELLADELAMQLGW